jgi:hypothetical protein
MSAAVAQNILSMLDSGDRDGAARNARQFVDAYENPSRFPTAHRLLSQLTDRVLVTMFGSAAVDDKTRQQVASLIVSDIVRARTIPERVPILKLDVFRGERMSSVCAEAIDRMSGDAAVLWADLLADGCVSAASRRMEQALLGIFLGEPSEEWRYLSFVMWAVAMATDFGVLDRSAFVRWPTSDVVHEQADGVTLCGQPLRDAHLDMPANAWDLDVLDALLWQACPMCRRRSQAGEPPTFEVVLGPLLEQALDAADVALGASRQTGASLREAGERCRSAATAAARDWVAAALASPESTWRLLPPASRWRFAAHRPLPVLSAAERRLLLGLYDDVTIGSGWNMRMAAERLISDRLQTDGRR